MNRCPSPEQLDNFLEERLGDSERSVIARHIDRCASCQAKLEELTSDVGSNSSVILQRTVLEPAVSGTSPVDFLSRVKENPPQRSGRSETAHDHRSPTGNGSNKFPTVASYEILGELGRGGMGVVYKARHIGLDRLVR